MRTGNNYSGARFLFAQGRYEPASFGPVSKAQVKRRDANHEWSEVVEFSGSMHQLQTSVAVEAKRNGWVVAAFVPIEYGARSDAR